jgi:hypothetical protein
MQIDDASTPYHTLKLDYETSQRIEPPKQARSMKQTTCILFMLCMLVSCRKDMQHALGRPKGEAANTHRLAVFHSFHSQFGQQLLMKSDQDHIGLDGFRTHSTRLRRWTDVGNRAHSIGTGPLLIYF